MKKALVEVQNKWVLKRAAKKHALKVAQSPGAGLAAALSISKLEAEIALCEEFIKDLEDLINGL